ncbi:MAG TPA: LamG-like jellyroll fold domain-containing protein [Chitinophaga sp.]|uniref:LamG-like jellyroll fold domain-containing protein n=1 Tax=Chitinophaga sp. TaxID=1869181 RepID=UPI002C5E68F5|nr:LamG-like jellyroll fold domain-containing protein [Chitinophaga sp.]HVI43641.1 LamG-like jellyroll fold domain-containing protein [Chitinophaga sp.]
MKTHYTTLAVLLLFLCNIATAQHNFHQQNPSRKEQEHEEKDDDEEYEKLEKANEKNEYAHAHSAWFREMLKPKPNIRKAQDAFDAYFKQHNGEDSKLKERFLTWKQQAALYMDKNGIGTTVPLMKKSSIGKRALAGQPAAADGTFGTWKMIGPTNMNRTQCGNNNLVTGGFCDRIYVNPYNTNNLFAGFSYGGLWVSKDQGTTWQLTDGSFPNGTNTYANRDYYYGEIEAHKLDSSLVFAATEAGLLKSTDGGINWTLLPQLNRNASPTERPYYLSLAANNKNIVLSTFGRKLYRSTDGGSTWSVVFDNSSGGANHFSTSQYNFNTPFGLNDRTFNFFGVENNFSNPVEFYLGVWNSSNQACIYKSTDKGATFSLLINLNTSLGTAWDKNAMLCMKTIPSSPSIFSVYQQYVNNKPRYRYSSAGALLSADTINAYVEAFDIDWNNKNIMYEGQYSPDYILKSSDSGKTFAKPYVGSCNYLHPDIRGISAVGNIVLVGNDGGLGLSTDGGQTMKGTGFEINSMDMWGFSSSVKSDICLTGLDHNQVFVRSFEGQGGWQAIKGADSGPSTVNPYNDHWLYYDWGYGVNKGWLNPNGTVTESSVAAGVDMSSLVFHSNLSFNIFGSNGNVVMQSSDNMTSATVFKDFGEKVNAFRVSRRDPKTMYALLSQNKIMKTTDSGATWVNVTPTSTVNGGQTNITAVEVGKLPGELWAAYGNAQNTVKVLYSTNGGSSWSNITSSNLPAVAVGDIAYQRGTNGGVYIFMITASGAQVWYKNNTMTQWAQVGSTLPMMGYLKGRLYVVPAKNKIRFGSSRGAWENDLYEQSGPEAGIAANRWNVVCSVDSVQFMNTSAAKPGTVTYQWSFPGGFPATSSAENPKVVYKQPGRYDVTLKITNADNVSDQITLPQFISMQNDICKADTVAGKELNISNATSRIPLRTLQLNSNTFTVTAWVKPKGQQGSFSQIISVRSPERMGIGFAFKGYTANTNLVVTNSTLSYGITSNIDLVPDQWNHIAVTYSPTSIKVYLNGGTPWETTGTFAAIDFSQTPMMINDDIHGQGGDFRGELEELSLYNYTLTQQEIREKMHLMKPGTDAGLMAYYQFNQYDSLSSTLYDAMSSGSSSLISPSLITRSTAPVAAGVSQRMTITAAGSYNFNKAGIRLNVSGSTLPNGEVVASRLYANPDALPSTSGRVSPHYWIVRNYGTNDSISPLAGITFDSVYVSVGDAATPSTFQLFKRPANASGATWPGSSCNATAATAGVKGTVAFGNNCSISRFGQFVLTTGGTSFIPCTGGPIPNKTTWITTASSEETVGEGASNGRAIYATDGNPATFWHTQWYNTTVPHPHDLIINLRTCSTIGGLSYLPRQNGVNGTITGYEIYISQDSVLWVQATSGTWPSTGTSARVANFTPQNGRYVKLRALSSVNNGAWSSAAEIDLSSANYLAPLTNTGAVAVTSSQRGPLSAGEILLYPNPAQNNITLEFQGDGKGTAEVTILDVSGKVYYQSRIAAVAGINKVQINTSTLPNGTYILNVTTGNKIKSGRRFIISRSN